MDPCGDGESRISSWTSTRSRSIPSPPSFSLLPLLTWLPSSPLSCVSLVSISVDCPSYPSGLWSPLPLGKLKWSGHTGQHLPGRLSNGLEHNILPGGGHSSRSHITVPWSHRHVVHVSVSHSSSFSNTSPSQ